MSLRRRIVSSSALEASAIGPLVDLVRSAFPNEGVRLDSAAVPNPFKGVNPVCCGVSGFCVVLM